MTVLELSVVALCATLAGCGSDSESGENGDNCPQPSAEVSFQNEVLPVFRRACGLSSSCHGVNPGSQAELYLGPKQSAPDPTPAERSALIAGLDQPSKTAPSMNLVAPGNPDQSFLQLKVDDTHNSAGLTCSPQPGAESGQPCGDSMPQQSPLLCQGERDILRQWIAQGAKDN